MEIKYVKCFESGTSDFTIGKIYNWPDPVDDKGTIRQIGILSGSLWSFEPSTEKAYNAQIITTEYVPQVGDYVVMEKAGGWGYCPENNGCIALVSKVGKNTVERVEVFSIWGEVINPNINKSVKFSNIPQIGYDKQVIFRKALPHKIPGLKNVKTEPQQVVEWEEKTAKITSPTEAILDQSPLDICRKKYKKGMLVRSAKEYGEFSGEFIIDVDPSEFTNTGSGVDYFASRGWLYINGKFADILEDPRESLTRGSLEFHAEMQRKFILDKIKQNPVRPEEAFPVKAIEKQIKKNKFQEVHEIKTVEEKLLKKTKSKLFNI